MNLGNSYQNADYISDPIQACHPDFRRRDYSEAVKEHLVPKDQYEEYLDIMTHTSSPFKDRYPHEFSVEAENMYSKVFGS